MTTYLRHVLVHYPAGKGRLVLRADADWDADMEPCWVSPDRTLWSFEVATTAPYLYFKPFLHGASGSHWAVGGNYLLVLTKRDPKHLWPFFHESSDREITEVQECPSGLYDQPHFLRIYLPAGYRENTLKRYGVLYMLDGSNLFFPEEAFLGQPWDMQGTLDLLDAMNAIDKTIIVGVYSRNREQDYTSPGYDRYARAMVEEVKPWVDRGYRTLVEPGWTGVMGSSLGGVAAFHQAWQYPRVFGQAACLSSTFSWRDDLIDRVLREPRRDIKVYLDSGWPGDNYEVTRAMAQALLERGYRFGDDLLYFSFPLAEHSEGYWAARVHLPVQLFSGKLPRSTRDTVPRVPRSAPPPPPEATVPSRPPPRPLSA